MTDPGLSHRLRQRSRRAGFMIGISMILTIAVCAVGFTVLYTALDGFTSDFISRTDEEPTEAPQIAQDTNAQQSNDEPADSPPEQPTQQVNEDPPAEDPTPTPEPEDPDGFNPDFAIEDGGSRINFREGPSTATGILDTLDPGTPLQYLNEDAPTDDDADGDRWMRFVTEDGVEGWVREIDVREID